MRLGLLFFLYCACTAAAIGTPFILRGIDHARRAAMPVNSEPPMEPAPPVIAAPTNGNGQALRPSCISDDSTEYFGDNGYFYTFDQPDSPRYFDSDLKATTFRSCAVGVDGTVFVLATRARDGLLRAYSPGGQLKWSNTIPETFSRPAVSNSGAVYVVVRPSGGVTELTAYGPDGASRWSLPIGRAGEAQANLVAPIIGVDGTVYAISGDSATPELLAISREGKSLWGAPLPGRARELLASRDGRLFVNIPFGKVLAFNLAGHEEWRFSSEGQNPEGGMVLGGDGTLYYAGNFLYALNREGKQKWTFKSDLTYTRNDYFDKHPVIADDGTVYAVSSYQRFYAITPAGRKRWELAGDPTNISKTWDQVILSTSGVLMTNAGHIQAFSRLARSGWPAPDHDNANRRSQEAP